MRVHYLQHVHFEALGYIETWLQENSHSITGTHFYDENYLLPEVEDIDALVIMGGPMGPFDGAIYPWLTAERTFIDSCIKAGKKLFGVCLGAQLIALALGANVSRAANKEVGWFRVMPTVASQALPWFYHLFKDSPVVLHWHQDRFEIPNNGGVELLYSVANDHQAFCYTDDIIGLQFHLEVTEATIQQMLTHAASDLVNQYYVQTATDIQRGQVNITHCNTIMSAILNNWLAPRTHRNTPFNGA